MVVTITNHPGNASQNHSEMSVTSHPGQLLPKGQKLPGARKNVEKREPLLTVDENINWYSHEGEQYGHSLKTLKNCTIL
jgi:hypothetical protein